MVQVQTHRQAGFTLIELVMVIVILGILSAFALPRFADLVATPGPHRLKGLQVPSNLPRRLLMLRRWSTTSRQATSPWKAAITWR